MSRLTSINPKSLKGLLDTVYCHLITLLKTLLFFEPGCITTIIVCCPPG
jgi:hypothetical protein